MLFQDLTAKLPKETAGRYLAGHVAARLLSAHTKPGQRDVI